MSASLFPLLANVAAGNRKIAVINDTYSMAAIEKYLEKPIGVRDARTQDVTWLYQENVTWLYQEMAPRLWAFLRSRRNTPPELIEDIVQETFLQVVTDRLRRLEHHDRVFPYLAGIAANVRSKLLKNQSRETLASDPHELELTEPVDGDLAGNVVDKLAIRAMVDALSSDVRDAALLRADGFEMREIAVHLGVPVNEVRSLLEQFRGALHHATAPPPEPAESTEPEGTTWLANPERDWGAALVTPQPAGPATSILERVDRAVALLPKRQREVMVRSLFWGLKPREIAKTLNITANSARVNQHHGYTSLAATLGMSRQQLQHIVRPLGPVSYAAPAA